MKCRGQNDFRKKDVKKSSVPSVGDLIEPVQTAKIKFVAEISNSIYTYLRFNLRNRVVMKSLRLTPGKQLKNGLFCMLTGLNYRILPPTWNLSNLKYHE